MLHWATIAMSLTQSVYVRRKNFIQFRDRYVSLAASLPRAASIIMVATRQKASGEVMDKKTGGGQMNFNSRDTATRVHTRPQIECAQCAEPLFMPEWSELMDERRVRHLWTCDACGYTFETTVAFAEAA